MCLEMLYISAGLDSVQLHATQAAHFLSLLYVCERSEAAVRLGGLGYRVLFWRHTCHVVSGVNER